MRPGPPTDPPRPAAPHLLAGPLGSTDLVVSRLGFGCYRVDDETPAHREAMEVALAAGCTLIDTSTNYTDGGSERLVGAVLEDLARRDRARRERITVVSKIGYVQGQNLRVALERDSERRPFPEMVKYMDGCWHCIHPEFLQDQLERSRRRLRVATLDVCLLHNPEYFLTDAHKRAAGDLESRRDEFYRRLGESFRFLEGRVRAGEIRWYGISSNTAVSSASDPEATSVSRMLAAAAEAGGPGHHFRVLQIPMNLLESGGALIRNTGAAGAQTPLATAAAAGLGVLINRPLNAMRGNRLLRLATVEVPPQKARLEELTATLKSLEKERRTTIPLSGTQDPDDELFQLVEQVGGLADQVEDLTQWQQIEQQYVIPRINHLAGAGARRLDGDQQSRWQSWWERYLPALQGLLFEIGRRAAEKSLGPAEAARAALDPDLPPGRRNETLSRLALWVLASTPGVSSVLVGMRRVAYVDDAMAILDWPPLENPLDIYARIRGAGV